MTRRREWVLVIFFGTLSLLLVLSHTQRLTRTVNKIGIGMTTEEIENQFGGPICVDTFSGVISYKTPDGLALVRYDASGVCYVNGTALYINGHRITFPRRFLSLPTGISSVSQPSSVSRSRAMKVSIGPDLDCFLSHGYVLSVSVSKP